jgi:acyl-CoA synthetase (AMP-forming)/AMP-acid ligase II/thioesterase domain-containing protein/acyl carrier protein
VRDLTQSSKPHFALPPEEQANRDESLRTSAMGAETRQVEFEQSIPQRLEDIAKQYDERIALTAPVEGAMTWARLCQQVSHMVSALNDAGIGRGDRVVLVQQDGVRMAAAFLGISAAATCTPLNPAYREHEFSSLFSELQPKALVIEPGGVTAAIAAAKRALIPLIEISPAGQSGIDHFSVDGEILEPPKQLGLARSDDVALTLFTSGTTAKPKLVPLTHANLLASAHNIAATLELTANDRCLNIMPLFHIHGLIGGLLTSLVCGGSVVCPPGFNAALFFDWLKEFEPTWYSAVPTMHQVILGRAPANLKIIRKHQLRFIRSSSAAMPARVMNDLEKTFKAPVIEAYGMTEAAHQMASNPLPPGQRKPGSVGRAAGPEISVMDDAGRLLLAGTIGEVVIRGTNVMHGYGNNSAANAKAFTHGWFRTGDQGYLDSDGYLFLTGRIKELINRAGEKISPREIDDVLMAHSAVEQAVTFAVAHPTLGEDVAAAVVLRRDQRITAADLIEFVAKKLAEFKVPRQIVIVDEIPRSPTGKLQRTGLAKKLGVIATDQLSTVVKVAYEPPQTGLEQKLAEIWRQVLHLKQIGRHDNFFHLGGYSLLAVQLVTEMEKRLGRNISVATLLNSPTIKDLARVLLEQNNGEPSPLIVIQPNGTRPPFFCAHGTDSFLQLAQYLGPDQPFYGLAQHLEGRKLRHTRIEDIATYYVKEIRSVQPAGPYYIGGHSLGGLIAYEMAQQLQQQDQEIGLLVLLDTRPSGLRPVGTNGTSAQSLGEQNLNYFSMRSLKRYLYFLPDTVIATLRKSAMTAACEVYHRIGVSLPPSLQTFYVDQVVYGKIYAKAHRSYVPQSYSGRAVYLKSEDARERVDGWKKLVKQGLEIHAVPGDHLSMLTEPHLRTLARTLKDCLAKAQKRVRSRAQSYEVCGLDRHEEKLSNVRRNPSAMGV